jgi:hypothetical protein
MFVVLADGTAMPSGLAEIKSELPPEQHGIVDVCRARYNDTNIVRHGTPLRILDQ